MHSKKEKLEAFSRLLDIMDELRLSCPWDKKQTFQTLRKLTIEETYELVEAILNNDKDEIKKELGDLLLHIVFYAKLGSETQDFDIADVCESISEKLIYRHPHIYGDTKVKDENEVLENWEKLKLKEKKDKGVLDGVPKALPAIVKANRIQEKVRGVGFDWDKKEEVWIKVEEELTEFKIELTEDNNIAKQENELGDLLFSIINAARLYGLDPETALEKTNQKFTKRFNYLEQHTIKKGKSLHDMSLEEMNIIWEDSKKFD
jgi:XTP/dITP diphosphohydrolase